MTSFTHQQVRQPVLNNQNNQPKQEKSQSTKQLQRAVPEHVWPQNIGARLHHRNWSNLDLTGKLEDIRLQLMLAERRLCHYVQKADVRCEMRKLINHLLEPISNAARFSGDRLKQNEWVSLHNFLDELTNHLPRTRDRAIQTLERAIRNCDKRIAKIKLDQKNEFLYTMGIRRQDLEPSGEDIFKQVFAEEIEEREAAQA